MKIFATFTVSFLRAVGLFFYYFSYQQAVIVLDTLVCAFSKYCKEEFQIERCKISASGVEWYPRMSERKENLSVKKINKSLGLKYVPVRSRVA